MWRLCASRFSPACYLSQARREAHLRIVPTVRPACVPPALASSQRLQLVRHLSSGPSARHVEETNRGVEPLILLLDLDETLIRAKVHGNHAHRELPHVDFRVFVDAKEDIELSVSKRPGLDLFFDWIRARRKSGALAGPWLFTQGHQAYADAILSRIDPKNDIFCDRVLSRDDCTPVATPGYVLKDLSRVPWDGKAPVERMVLVDNNAISAILYPCNTFLIRDWLGKTPDGAKADVELERVASSLDAVMEGAAKGAGAASVQDPEAAPCDYRPILTGMDVTPGGREDVQQRLRGLRDLLDTQLEERRNVPALRKQMQGVWNEALAVKRLFLRLENDER